MVDIHCAEQPARVQDPHPIRIPLHLYLRTARTGTEVAVDECIDDEFSQCVGRVLPLVAPTNCGDHGMAAHVPKQRSRAVADHDRDRPIDANVIEEASSLHVGDPVGGGVMDERHVELREEALW